VFGRQWYKEVLIVVVMLNIIHIVISMFVPFPLNSAFSIILLVVVIIWRIRKKKLTVKEAITLVLISTGIGLLATWFIPFPLSFVSYPLIFVTIWWIYKKTSPTMDQFP
jgi:hypothetical protein